MRGKGHAVAVGVSLEVSGDVKENPLGVVKGLANASRSVEAKLKEAVHEARRQRCTWEELGEALGISRQAAWERFSTDT